MKLQARKYLRYAGKRVRAGEVFDARDADVRILLAIGSAEKYEPPKEPKPIPNDVEARIQGMIASGMATEEEAEETRERLGYERTASQQKRAYKRRDMTAEK